jgi:antirestriction protein ArdC
MAKTQEQIYLEVTNRIVELLEKGTVPWTKSWNPGTQLPMNFETRKPYRGVNIWMLMYSGFTSRYWVTFRQIQNLGGKVKKGEKSRSVVYWNFRRFKDEKNDDKVISIPFLKEYRVFNLEQTEGIEIPDNELEVLDFTEINSAQEIVDFMPLPPSIVHEDQDRAYYSPTQDLVMMPERKQFKSEEQYYQVLFHELSHSTGHENRLSRKEVTEANMFGSHAYSKEELVAEFSSSFLCGVAGIDKEEITQNTVAYIQSWSKKLKENPKWLVSACGKATKSANFILGIDEETKEEK